MARYELNLRDYYRILRRHIIVIAAISFGLGSLSFLLSSTTEMTYQARATVRVTQASDLVGMMLQTFTWNYEDNTATQTILISSQPVLLETAKELSRTSPDLFPDLFLSQYSSHEIPDELTLIEALNNPRYNLIISRLEGRIIAEQVLNSSLIDIIATYSSAPGAKELARATAAAYEKYSLDAADEQNRQATRFINGELTRVRVKLDSAQSNLKKVRRSNLPYSSSDAASLMPLIERRNTFHDRITTLSELRLRLSDGSMVLPAIGTSIDPTTLAQYTEIYPQLTELMNERSRLLLTYTEEAEPIQVLDERIDDVRGEFIYAIDNDITFIRTRLSEYDRLLHEFPDEEVELATFQQVVELNTQLVTQLEISLQEVQIRSAGQIKEVTTVNLPTIAHPDQQGGQGLKTIIGLLLGFMLGIIVAFVIETMDTSIGTIEDVEEYIEVPVLAVIPHLPVEKMSEQLVEQNPQLKDDPNLGMFARLITQYDSKSPAAEAYRTLRTNLQFAIGGTGESIETKNTFLFTSSSLQEGKSTTLANLAITIAQAGNRVLLMGCNMRRPTIYKSFGLSLESGMTDILTGQKEWRECVKGITDMMVGPLSLQNIMQMPGLDNLSIVTSGGIPPNPSELLSSPRFSQMIEEASEEYDMVLVDCPPILPVTDAAIVGRQVDWSVLIYQVGKVPRNALRRAKFHLSNVGAHVLGLAMNDVKAEIGGYSPYSQYMIKYYGEETKEKKTLLGMIGGLFKKGDQDFEEKRDRARLDSHRITGAQSDSPWIKVDYFDELEEESEKSGEGGEHGESGVIEDMKPPEPATDDGGDTGDESWLRKIPLWAWIALAAAVILLVISTIMGSCSDTTAQAIEDPPPPVPVEQTSSQPAEKPAPDIPPVKETLVWSVHVGSFRTAEEAESLKAGLTELHMTGTDRIWTRTEEVPGLGQWNRVFVGLYQEREACERSAVLIRKTGQVTMAGVRHVTPPTP